jgi:hypothetical protein
MKNEEEDMSSCWMTLKKRENTGILKKKHWLALSKELALTQAMHKWQSRL